MTEARTQISSLEVLLFYQFYYPLRPLVEQLTLTKFTTLECKVENIKEDQYLIVVSTILKSINAFQ